MSSTLWPVLFTVLGALPGSEAYLEAYQAESHGRHGDAVRSYDAAAEQDGPLQRYARVRAAAARGRAGDNAGAIAELSRVLAESPVGPWTPLATYELAVIRARTQQHREASEAYLLALNTDAPLWWLDEYRRVAALHHLQHPETAPDGYAYFRTVAATTRFIAPRAQAAELLMKSSHPIDLLTAADALMRGKSPKDAKPVVGRVSALGDLSEDQLAELAVMSARVAMRDGRYAEAEETLSHIAARASHPDSLAAAYLDLVSFYAQSGHYPRAESVAEKIDVVFEGKPEPAEARWQVGKAYERKKDYANALRTYREITQRFPKHTRAADALMALGKLLSEARDTENAVKAFDAITEHFAHEEIAAEAGFAAGQLLEKSGNNDAAIKRYERTGVVGLGTYTGHRAQSRLYALQDQRGPAMPHECGDREPLVRPTPGLQDTYSPDNSLEEDERIQRLRFFAAHGMPEAEWEVLGLTDTLRESLNPAPLYLAVAQAGTAYSAMQIADAENWGLDETGVRTPDRQRVRFPLAYWPLVRELSEETGVDPYLILSVARQESTYRPALTSHAGARGVMQVMPATAEWLAQVEAGIPSSAAAELENPQVSIRMGAYYLMRMLERSNGNVVHALASYNAGPGNCDKWRRRFGNVSSAEFVEKIPFSETQGYVKRVMGFYAAYHSLYPAHMSE